MPVRERAVEIECEPGFAVQLLLRRLSEIHRRGLPADHALQGRRRGIAWRNHVFPLHRRQRKRDSSRILFPLRGASCCPCRADAGNALDSRGHACGHHAIRTQGQHLCLPRTSMVTADTRLAFVCPTAEFGVDGGSARVFSVYSSVYPITDSVSLPTPRHPTHALWHMCADGSRRTVDELSCAEDASCHGPTPDCCVFQPAWPLPWP